MLFLTIKRVVLVAVAVRPICEENEEEEVEVKENKKEMEINKRGLF